MAQDSVHLSPSMGQPPLAPNRLLPQLVLAVMAEVGAGPVEAVARVMARITPNVAAAIRPRRVAALLAAGVTTQGKGAEAQVAMANRQRRERKRRRKRRKRIRLRRMSGLKRSGLTTTYIMSMASGRGATAKE